MILVSAVIFVFLLWLLYLREPVSTESGLNVGFLPPLNAFLNALSALCLAAARQRALRAFKKALRGGRKPTFNPDSVLTGSRR